MKKIRLKVTGMSCGHCVGHVTEALEELEGVEGPTVSLDQQTAEFEAGPDFDVKRALAAIDEAGYSATELS